MGQCKKKTYTSNDVVLFTRPLPCYGFKQHGQVYHTCKFLNECREENGMKKYQKRFWK